MPSNSATRPTGWCGSGPRREDGALCVDVADNGIGIAPENLDRIFERFQQAGNTLTDKPHGTGLGLPISRQILDRFGGDLWVDERARQGRNVFV